jgi:hypothetical protein
VFVLSLLLRLTSVSRGSYGMDADAKTWVDVTHQHGMSAGWKPLRKDAAQKMWVCNPRGRSLRPIALGAFAQPTGTECAPIVSLIHAAGCQTRR